MYVLVLGVCIALSSAALAYLGWLNPTRRLRNGEPEPPRSHIWLCVAAVAACGVAVFFLTSFGATLIWLAWCGMAGWLTTQALPIRAEEGARRRKPPTLAMRVVAAQPLTERIKRFELVSADGSPLPPFTAGAHVNVHIPGGLVRSYSLFNDPERRDRYEIAVLRERESRGGSAFMHEQLKVGDVIQVQAPENNFRLDETGRSHILIAGGIGITPILSMAARLSRIGAPFKMYYCTRNRQEAAFAEAIEQLFGDAAELIHDNGVPECGLNLRELLAAQPPGTHLYFCGPRGMIDAAREASAHWADGTVHYELFSASRSPGEFGPNEAFEVELARSKLRLPVPAEKSLLEVLHAADIEVQAVCEEGVCGTCKARVLSGEVDHRDEYLSEGERKQYMQVCVSRAPAGQTLVLDL